MSLGDRVTPLGGCPNFRHMGGYRTGDGRTTRADRLFRTGCLELPVCRHSPTAAMGQERRMVDTSKSSSVKFGRTVA
jgi:hypothetical protein